MWLVEPITDVFFPAGGEDCEAVKLMQLRGAAVQEILGGAPPLCPARRPGRGNGFQSVLPLQRAKAQASGQGADKTIIYTENKQHKQIFMPKSLTITA